MCAVQLATLSQGMATGQGLESLHGEMHRAKVPWLEVHAPGGIQVTTQCSSYVVIRCARALNSGTITEARRTARID